MIKNIVKYRRSHKLIFPTPGPRRVSSQLDSVYDSAPSETRAPRRPRLLAVSKTKPADMVIKVYQEGHRCVTSISGSRGTDVISNSNVEKNRALVHVHYQ